MLKNRLLAATAAIALAIGQVTPGYALLPSPQYQTPDGTDPLKAANAGFVSTAVATAIANLKTLLPGIFLPHVANVAALAAYNANYGYSVHRDDVGVDYYDYGASCPAPDGGTQVSIVVNGATVPGHCWYAPVDRTPITPELFASYSTTDATAAFQAAANARCFGTPVGGKVILAAKQYNFAGTTSISYSCAVQWEGAGWSELPLGSGTWLHIASTGSSANGGAPLFSLTNPNTRGTTWSRFGVAEDQQTPGPGWTATAYPVVFNIVGIAGGARFRDIMAGPVYDLILSDDSGRTDFCGVYGQILHYGIQLGRSFDTTHASCGAIHFWPYWSVDTNVLVAGQTGGSTGLVLGRVDGATISDMFLYGFNNGVMFIKDPNTPDPGGGNYTNGASFGTLYTDATVRPIYARDATDQGALHYPNGIHIDSLNASCSGFGSDIATGSSGNSAQGGTAIRVDGAIELHIGQLTVQACQQPTIDLTSSTIGSRISVEQATIHDLQNSLVYVTAVTQAGSLNHDVVFGMRTYTDGPSAGFLFQPDTAPATVSLPLLENLSVTVAANGTYGFPVATAYATLNGSTTSIAGVTFDLPANPYPGQVAGFESTSTLTGFTLGVGTSGEGIAPSPPTTITAYQTYRYRYQPVGRVWIAF